MIEIVQVSTKKQLKEFIKFQFNLYKASENWVPPIISEELDNFDKGKNPAFKDADAWFFLAYRDNKIVGRVCAIVNWEEVKKQGNRKLRFGWFDLINDQQVCNALLDKVVAIGKEHQLEYIEGPAGFSNMDKAGMLIEGYDRIGSMPTNYNYAYYPELIENYGFKKEVDWKEFEIMMPKGVPDKVTRFAELVLRKYNLRVLDIPNTKTLLPYAEKIFDLMNRSHQHLESFTPIKPYQVEHYKNKYLKFLDPDFVILIADEDDNLVGFSVIMPSFSKALQKANGKLFPFGFYHLLKAQKSGEKVTMLLIGVAPEYMRKGLTATIFDQTYKTFVKRGTKVIETNPELETNNQVLTLWKDYDPQLIKKWRTYRKYLS